MGAIPINKSVFSDEFLNVVSDGIYLLSKDSALEFWKEHIDEKSASYFSLNDDSWIANASKSCVGQWIQGYNHNRNQEVEALLKTAVSWGEDDTIFFCISKYFIITSPWLAFKKAWRSFLECHDDCPIVVNTMYVGSIIIFTPIGDILKSDLA